MKLFVNTDGQKGMLFTAREVILPKNKQARTPTKYVICNPYRRVYEDDDGGLYVIWNKHKVSTYQVKHEVVGV